MLQKHWPGRLGCFILLSTLIGCATHPKDPRDPLENWNRGVQSFNDKLDHYAMQPVAKAYQWITPAFVNRGVTNFFSNVGDIGVTMNDLLQCKFWQTGQDGARFLVNSVAGLGGFVDTAAMLNLPRHNEDFDQTLGVWGVPSGPYLVLPFFGPSSTRGIGGMIGDAAMNPISYVGSAAITSGLFALNAVDLRADNLSTEKIATEAALDRYDFFKNAYFQQRDYLVRDGNMPEGEAFHEDEMDFERNNAVPVKPY